MNILRSYAVFNPEIEYCQGLNYLGGFFYLIYRNENIAFSMLCSLIANFKLADLYKDNMPMLQLLFYQLTRLIAIYLPKLHLYLFQEGVKVSYFSPPWFLTGFTFVLQSCTNCCIPILLNEIFDDFLIVRFNKR